MAKTPAQPKDLKPIDNGYGASPEQVAAMHAAAAQARKTKTPVAVDALTTETQQVLAQPKGGFELTSNPKPVRTLQQGAWVPVDTTLHKNTDGTLSPAATAYGTVVLSGGGTGPLATTSSGDTSVAVSWPTPLPKPTVSGSTATYPNVLPDVDLVVSATDAGGFSEVLVVKNAAAAQNPALAELRLATEVTGGQLTGHPDSRLSVTGAPGANTLVAATPKMWDSNTSLTANAPAGKAAPTPPADAKVAADDSDAQHPGMAARIAVVHTTATPSSINLVPDQRLLTDAATVYPVYIDPSFNWSPATGGTPAFDEVKQGWPCPNTSFFNDTVTDNGRLAVGYNNWSSCIGIMRTFYQWQLPTVIWGAHIGNVSGQPGATVNVSKIYSASCSTTSTDWLHWSGGIGPGTNWNNQPDLGPLTGPSISIGPACPNAVPGSFDVTSQIATSASAHYGQFTVALTGNETPGMGNVEFSRFSNNPSLQIFYNLYPDTPGANQLSAVTGANNVGCATNTPYPYMGKTISSNTPVLNAYISDPDGDQLQAAFDYWVEGAAVNTGWSADNLASGSNAQFSLPPSFVSSLTNGQIVDWHVHVTDGMDWSDWSPTCHFIAQPTAPDAPPITSADNAYPGNGHVGAAAGTPGRFTFTSPTSTNTTSFVYGLDQQPPTVSPPASQIASFNGGGDATPTGRWTLSDGTGPTAADTAGNHPVTLSGGATWTTDATRGKVLTFNGSTGSAATGSPVLNTTGSFSISAWVNVAQFTTSWQTFVVQQANTASGLYLEYDPGTNRWAFTQAAADTTNPSGGRAESSTVPQPGVWTHLVGVYDSTNGAMTLYVNGVASGSASVTTPIASNGPLVLGRGYHNGTVCNFMNGSLSDVQTYQHALTPSEIAQIYGGGIAAPTGRWRFFENTSSTAADSSGKNHPATLTGGYAWTSEPQGAVSLDGVSGSAATTGPVLDTSKSFTASAWVKLNNTNGYQTVLVQQGVNVGGLYLEYDPGANRWSFARFANDSTATVYRALSTNPPQLNTWTQLAGVYDAASGTMSLYVNGVLNGTATDTTPWNATGPLAIGHGFYGGAANNNYVNGFISDVQTYQSALSAAEIAAIYRSSTIKIAPLAPGPHTLWAYATDPAGNVSSYQSFSFIAAGDPSTTCASLAACFNNTAISPDSNMSLGAADGYSSFSATDLANAGWNSGGNVTIDGATFTLPTFGAGQADNILAANQTITYNQAVPATGATSLEFLAASTNPIGGNPGTIAGNTTAPYVPAGTAVTGVYCFNSTNPAAYCVPKGKITYTDGTSQTYNLAVPDWLIGPWSTAAFILPHWNRPSGQVTTSNPSIYPLSVPLTAGKTVASVTLPDVGTQTQRLHIFGMATRNTTTANAPNGQTWTGTWANATEAEASPAWNNETIRIAAKPSLSGNTLRVKFDDALGSSPLSIGHATIALDSSNGTSSAIPSAIPSGSFSTLTFGGSQSVTIPEGGMVYSDPLTFPVTANQYLLISFHLANSVPYLVEHTASNTAFEYVAAPGSGDKTTDTTGTPFSGTGTQLGWFSNVVTALDVATNNIATQAVLGDGLIDALQPNVKPILINSGTRGLPDILAAAEPTTPSPYGTIAEGIESNQVMTDNIAGGPSLLSRIDRDVLDQPGITTVVLYEGLEDVLKGQTAKNLAANAYTQLLYYLQAYGINVITIGLTPCDGYAGGGGTPNDPCTTAVDKERTTTNSWLSNNPVNLNPWSTPQLYYINPDTAIGVTDTTNNEIKLHSNADAGDHVNLTLPGYAALASAYLGPQDTWRLNDGTGATMASDSATNTDNPYLINNSKVGANPATLAGTTSWVKDTTRGTVLQLDGTTGNAATSGPVLTTNGSFTVSAWANLTPTTHSAVIASQDGNQNSAFTLGYNATANTWSFTMPTADTANAPTVEARSTTAPTTGAWTHLVGTYNATTNTLSLYVNGTLTQTATLTTPWNATGPLALGRAKTNAANTSFFPGSISNVQAWNYTLSTDQVTALYQQIS